jgi:hypothetical protein
MPPQDQDLNYKVKLDTADLAAQLQQVRAQIDQAVGSVAFNSTAMASQPTQFAFPIQDYARQAGLLAQADMQNLASTAQMGGRHIATMAEAAQLGFQKFNNDVQTALLTQGTPLINTASGGYYPDPSQRSFTSNAAAALIGWGYDPKYSITPGEFNRLSSYQAASQVIDAGLISAGSLVGGALGTLLPLPPIIGTAVGQYVGGKVGGFVNDAVAATVLRDFTYGQKIKEYAWNTSWRFLGGRFSREEAGRIGENLSTEQRSTALLGYDITANDVSRVMSEFTGIGGFDYVRSADEYQTKARSMIDNHRKIMQVLKVTEDEALSIIKEFNLQSPNADIGAMTMRTAVSAYASGLTGREMSQFANQASELVRGTGISMASAFWGGMDTLESVKAGMAGGSIPLELIRQYGGAENYALNVNRIGYNWAQSTSGYTQFAAASALGGLPQTIGLSPTQTMGAAVGMITQGGLQYMLERQGAMADMISLQDPQLMAAYSSLQFAHQMYAAGLAPTRDAFIGTLQNMGMSQPEAALRWNSMMPKVRPNRAARISDATQLALDETPSTWSIVYDVFGNDVSSAIQSPGLTGLARQITTGVENLLDSHDTAALGRAGFRRHLGKNGKISYQEIKPKGFVGPIPDEELPWQTPLSERFNNDVFLPVTLADMHIASGFLGKMDVNPTNWIPEILGYGFGLWGRSETKRSDKLRENVTEAMKLSAESEKGGADLKLIQGDLLRMGGVLQRSAALSNDPMLVITHMNNEIAANNADATNKMWKLFTDGKAKVMLVNEQGLYAGK